jgi:CRP/FNR family transcriptional regulator, cyclic AMP receptor protein
VRALDHGGALGALSHAEELELRRRSTLRRFRPGDVLFPVVLFPSPPTPSHTVLITKGLVKLTANAGNGHPTVLSIHGPGDLLGEHDALRYIRKDLRRQPTSRDQDPVATALTEVAARSFQPQTMARFLESHPEDLAAVAISLYERLEEAESRIASVGQDNADRRLARLLCDLERYGDPMVLPGGRPGTRIPIDLTQAELAAWVGACTETVGRVLRRWRARGIVSTRYRVIVVHDLEALARIAGVEVRRRSWNWGHQA